jgi:hypothetical protein
MANSFDSSGRKFLLFGDLHLNSKSFAEACESGGADAVVFHLNQDSLAGGRFGGLELEEDSIRDSLSVLKIPAGLTIGDARPLLEQEWESITSMGLSFVNMFAHQFPTFVWRDTRMKKIISIGPGYILEQVKALSEFDAITAIIAALTPNQGAGMQLTLLDITTLKLISRLSTKPIYLPTQRMVRKEDLSLVREQGCNGILLTSTVYGDNADTCKEQIATFRGEIDKLVPEDGAQTFTNLR